MLARNCEPLLSAVVTRFAASHASTSRAPAVLGGAARGPNVAQRLIAMRRVLE
jgi:hypothetical protein